MTWLALAALAAWAWLVFAHDGFWRSGPELPPGRPGRAVPIDVVVPARNEAETIGEALASLLAQDYSGPMRILMVDDGSTDGTAEIARALGDGRLTVVAGRPTPPGWSGKPWAMAQGVAQAEADFVLLTDADIVHAPGHLSALATKAEEGLDLVSEMVTLRCESFAERALVPAFVYFFQLLFPFAAVNEPERRIAAAAGGSMLVRRAAVERAGGIAAIKDALIDDVALAKAIKSGGRIWLGHTRLAQSRRAYPGFADIWRMIARTAFVQLRHSALLLAGTVLGLGFLFLVPPLAAVLGAATARWAGLAAWALGAVSFVPTLTRFRRKLLWAPALPAIATFYLAATVGSAIDHWRGRGVVWKGRQYRGAHS
ncbi:MAG TPA: glycosyltransferase [Acetobacteraceae bacterium]|nr:glycosyltransferase [Acetobacteraceae bacterium]